MKFREFPDRIKNYLYFEGNKVGVTKEQVWGNNWSRSNSPNKHFIDWLYAFPLGREVIDAYEDNQAAVGNPRDFTVLYNNIFSNSKQSGFNWFQFTYKGKSWSIILDCLPQYYYTGEAIVNPMKDFKDSLKGTVTKVTKNTYVTVSIVNTTKPSRKYLEKINILELFK